MSVRRPAVAGMFYAGEEKKLRREIEKCFLSPGGPGSLPTVNPEGPRRILGLVSPHAGFIYSGSVAAGAYHELAADGLPDAAVILGPNHRSYLPGAALSGETGWVTPLGEIAVDAGITRRFAELYPHAEISVGAHRDEHSIEVQVPFLQYLAEHGRKTPRIVPILVGGYSTGDPLAFARELGRAAAEAVRGIDSVFIASTDFTHYETGDSALRKDSRAVEAILALDEEVLLRTVKDLDISMCGVLPTAAVICACRQLGATAASSISYRNSGDVTGDYSQVVGYSALIIHR